jgi:AcrR family transcriptional regulator
VGEHDGTGPRGTLERVDYFAAAYAILGEVGSEGITIHALCERLGVTKGSFYHHFENLEAFVHAFAGWWQTGFTARLAQYNAIDDRIERAELMLNATAGLAHGPEAALRSWSVSEPIIKAAIDRIDAAGEDSVLRLAALFVDDPEEAALFAHHGVSLAVGMQHRAQPVDVDRYLEVLAQWARLGLGVDVEVVVTARGRMARVRERRHG